MHRPSHMDWQGWQAHLISGGLIVPPENREVALRNFCASFAASRNRAIFAMERNFRATLAQFVADNLPFLGNFVAKWNL